VSPARPRLFFVNRVYWPSTEATAQLLTDLATGLAARGWDVHIIAAGTDLSAPGGVQVHRTGPGEKHTGLASRAFNYVRFLLGARRHLRSLVASGDVVITMTDPPLLAALTHGPARRRGARIVHWAQDIYPEILTAHLGGWTTPLLAPLRILRNRALQLADAGVTLGTDMATVMTAIGCAPGRLHVIPNWAPRELGAAPAVAAVQAQRAAWGLADKFIVAYSGNLGRVHEFATIIAAAERLRDDPAIAFVFIGAGARFPEVRRAVTGRQLGNVHFFPATPRAHLAV
jgi:colanic acid biosynthesis glycosyl transferase WcaI